MEVESIQSKVDRNYYVCGPSNFILIKGALFLDSNTRRYYTSPPHECVSTIRCEAWWDEMLVYSVKIGQNKQFKKS